MGNASAYRRESPRALVGDVKGICWAVYDGIAPSDADKKQVSFFQFPADRQAGSVAPDGAGTGRGGAFTPAKATPEALAGARAAAKNAKALMHPQFLKVHEVIGQEGDGGSVGIVCDRAVPLFTFLASRHAASALACSPDPSGTVSVGGLAGSDSESSRAGTLVTPELVRIGARAWIAAGAYSIGSALAFLHERGMHCGTMGPWSVYVTSQGEWRLGLLPLCGRITDSAPAAAASIRAALCPDLWADPAGASASTAMASDWRGFACCVIGAAAAATAIADATPAAGILIGGEASTDVPGSTTASATVAKAAASSSSSLTGGGADIDPDTDSADKEAAGRATLRLVESVLGSDLEATASAVSGAGVLPREWLRWLRPLLSADPGRRAAGRAWGAAIKGSLLLQPAVATMDFLAELPIKTSAEKQSFFGGILAVVPRLPRCLREAGVLPRLLDALQFGHAEGGGTAVLAPVLAIGAGMRRDEYRARVVPAVIRLFGSRDRATRVQLMRHASSLLPHIDGATLQAEVWPRAAEGMADTVTTLREATLKALPVFARCLPAAGRAAVIRAAGRLHQDSELAIRANCAVCAGMVAEHLSVEERSTLALQLLAAIARDPAAAARVAALRAATHVVGSPRAGVTSAAASGRALSLAGATSVDPVLAVREEGLKLLAACLGSLREHSARAAAAEAAAAETALKTGAGGAEGGSRSGGASGAAGAGEGSGASGWAGWAGTVVASAASAAVGASAGISRPAAAAGATSNVSKPLANFPKSVAPASAPAAVAVSASQPPAARPPAPAPAPAPEASPVPAEAWSSSAWDELDEFGTISPQAAAATGHDEEDMLGVRASAPAAVSAPALVSSPAPAPAPATGWDFDDGW